MGWLARYVVKRATWGVLVLVVGLLWAYLAAGVDAAETLRYTRSGSFSLGGSYSVDSGHPVTVTAGETVRIKIAGYGGGSGNVAVSYNGTDCNLSCDAWYTGPDVDFVVPSGATSMRLVGRNNGGASLSGTSYEVFLVTPDPTPSPTPTPTPTAEPTATPTPEPTPVVCDPCVVELSEVDRERLDVLQGSVAFGMGLVIFLGAAIAAAVGFRR